jgi:hypothetical protein
MENIKDGRLKKWHKALEFFPRVPYNMSIELIDDVPTSLSPADCPECSPAAF